MSTFVLLIVTAALVGYLFVTAEIEITAVSVQEVSAADDPIAFHSLQNAVAQDTFYGTLYQKPSDWKNPSEYVFLTYTLRVRNNCLVPIDMLEAQVIPRSEDILQTADLQVKSIEAKSEDDLIVRILTPKGTQPSREIIVSYYLWGKSSNVKTVYDP